MHRRFSVKISEHRLGQYTVGQTHTRGEMATRTHETSRKTSWARVDACRNDLDFIRYPCDLANCLSKMAPSLSSFIPCKLLF